jgi:hypothetical protein
MDFKWKNKRKPSLATKITLSLFRQQQAKSLGNFSTLMETTLPG